jgi:hypothetical protein
MSEVTSVNGKTGAVVLTSADVEAVPSSAVGKPNGVATLNASGVLPEGQLPGSVVSESRIALVKCPGATTDVGPTIQAAYDAGATVVELEPGFTYFINTPIFVEGANRGTRYGLKCKGATLRFGTGLPTASTWVAGIGVTPKIAFFPNTERTALAGSVVTTSAANAVCELPSAPRFVIEDFLANATQEGDPDICIAYGNQAAPKIRDAVLQGILVGVSWTGYVDEVVCDGVQAGAASPSGNQTRIIYQRDSGDGTTCRNCKAFGGYIADLSSCHGFLIEGQVSGQINLIGSQGTIVTGHQETNEVSGLPWSIRLDRSQVTLIEEVVFAPNKAGACSILVEDTAGNDVGSRIFLKDCTPTFYYGSSATTDLVRQPHISIAAANHNFLLKCEGTRSIVLNNKASTGVIEPEGGIWVESVVEVIQKAIEAGADLIAGGDFELHYDATNVRVTGPQKPIVLSAPTLVVAADTLGTPGALAEGQAYSYVAALKSASGVYTPLSGAVEATAGASKSMKITLSNVSAPCVVALWRKTGAGVAAGADHYIELPLDAPNTSWWDTGTRVNGRLWKAESVPVPNTVAGTTSYAISRQIAGAIFSTFDRATGLSSGLAQTSGNRVAALIEIERGTTRTLSKVNMRTGTTAGVKVTHLWWALTDLRGNVLAVTADAAAAAANSTLESALASPINLAPGLYYLQRLIVAETMPTEVCTTGTSTGITAVAPVIFGNAATAQNVGPPTVGENIGVPSTAAGQLPYWWGT